VIAPASMVGSLATVVNGYALAFRARSEDRVALTWIGDGATKSGEVHEALNFAAVSRLPVIFVLQNNQVALGTAVERHHRPRGFGDWGRAYGVKLFEAAGNNVLDVFAAASLAAESCRAGEGPAFVAVETFRMGGHATHDVREARERLDPELFARWGRRDPIGLYEEYLTDLPLDLASDPSDAAVAGRRERNRAVLEAVEAEVREEIEAAAAEALASRDASVPPPDSAGEEACYG
jgi:pyruvate dehydrogenase E1 component alpha subunit